VKLFDWCHNFWNDARLYERIVFVVGALFLLSWGGHEYSLSRQASPPPLFVPAPDDAKTIRVHIKGAVNKPSLLTLPIDARLNSAIQRAGGITKSADTTSLNLAAPLRDGQEVVVPFQGAAQSSVLPLQPPHASSKTPSDGRLINVNTASTQELEALPGVGPAIAARILEEREKQPFTNLQDLDRVKGIGPKKLQKMAAYVTF
jgi:competence protein ComEA